MPRVRRVRRVRNRTRKRRYCLTFHGSGGVSPNKFITAEDCARWQAVITLGNDAEHAGDVTFFIVQTEKGGVRNRVHYQAYVEFKRPVEWSTVKKIFGEEVHIENSQGNAAANIRYCSKVDTRYEDEDICIDGSYGTAKRGGTKLQAALDIKAGMRMEKFEEKFPAMLLMNRPRIEMAMAHANGARTTEPKIVILTGLTGTGKTQYCVNEYANEYWVNPSKSGSGIWWGSYYGQKVVVMDEFTDSWFQLKFLLRLWQQAPIAAD